MCCFSWRFLWGAVFVLLPFLFSCRSTQTIVDHQIDSVLIYRDTTIYIEGRSDTFFVTELVHDTVIKNEKGNSVQLKKEPKGIKIVCNEAELQLKLDSVIQLKRIKEVEHIKVIVERCHSAFHQFTKSFFFIFIFIGLLYLGYKIRK